MSKAMIASYYVHPPSASFHCLSNCLFQEYCDLYLIEVSLVFVCWFSAAIFSQSQSSMQPVTELSQSPFPCGLAAQPGLHLLLNSLTANLHVHCAVFIFSIVRLSAIIYDFTLEDAHDVALSRLFLQPALFKARVCTKLRSSTDS